MLVHDLAQKMLKLKGGFLDLKGRPYLVDIYNSDAQRTILKFGRQSEKSTTLSAKISINTACIPYFNTLFVSPSASQTKDFSLDRLDQFMKNSEYIIDHLYDQTCSDRIDQKSLLNGSNVYLRYAFLNADRTRGISADQIVIDEIQDIRSENISVIEEAASHSERGMRGHPFKSFIYAGTPKGTNNSIEFHWKRSTMREWSIKCEGCGHWALELNIKNIGKEHLVCEKCDHRLYPQTGRWIITNPGAPIEGYHISQLGVPWLDWKKDILFKLAHYPSNRFYNEVLGLSYDSGSKPLTMAHLRQCCNQERTDWWKHDVGYIPRPLFAGIDWALTAEKSFTILTIGAWLPYPEKFVIIFQKKYDGNLDVNQQVEDIKMICDQYDVDLIGADWGAGVHNNLKLMEYYGANKVAQYYNSGSQKNRIAWNAKRMMFTISRTIVMTDLFNYIQKGQLEWPKYEVCEGFLKDFLNEDVEYNKDGVMYYDHNPDNPDDAIHSTMYCMLAGELFYTNRGNS